MAMEESILKATKKKLGLDAAYKAFDEDVLIAINTAFFKLNQLGLGPDEGFMVEGDDEKWEDYFEGKINLNGVKSYIYLCARLEFDPPGTPHHIKAMEDQKAELEYRLRMDNELLPRGAPVVLEGGLG